MKLHVIVNINLILLHFTSAFYDGIVKSRYGLSNGILGNVTALSNVDINAVCPTQNKKCLWRCCPPGKHIMARKECRPSNISFANITVYDEYFQNTFKSLETVFQLVSGIMSDKIFAKNAFPYSFLAQPYLVEDGNLYLEMPNSFHRWTKIETNHFCVDMKVSEEMVVTVFMAEMRKEMRESYDIVNYVYALDVTVCFLLLTILPYALFPQLRDINGVLFIIFLTFFTIHMIIVIHTLSFESPTLLGFLITGISFYFCFVSSVCWTNVMFYRILTSNNTKEWTMREVILYGVYAVGVPLSLATLVAVTEITDMTHIPWFVTPKIIDFGLCFFDGMESLYYLYIPLGLLLLFNWTVCIVNVVRFFKTFKGFQIVEVRNNERELISPLAKTTQYVKLLILLTFYGIVNVLTTVYPHYDKGSDVCFFFTLFIGPVIFITFVIDKNVFKMAKQLYVKFRSSSKFNLSSRSV